MTKEKTIEQLLSAFYEGHTTPEEELILYHFLTNNEVYEQYQADRIIVKALYDSNRVPLPEGIYDRLDSALTKHIQRTDKRRLYSKTKTLYIRLMSAAAIILLCVGVFFFTDRASKSPLIADTFTNPKEAAIAAEQALLLVSSKLNQGLAPYEKFKKTIIKTDEIIKENLNIN